MPETVIVLFETKLLNSCFQWRNVCRSGKRQRIVGVESLLTTSPVPEEQLVMCFLQKALIKGGKGLYWKPRVRQNDRSTEEKAKRKLHLNRLTKCRVGFQPQFFVAGNKKVICFCCA